MSTRTFQLALALLPGLLASNAFAQGADLCSMAQPISGIGTFAFDNTLAATDGVPDPLCLNFGQDDIENDVWYAWTAPSTGTFAISACNGLTIDTRIAVYATTSCPTAAAIVCDDDSCTGLQSSALVSATGGTTYLVRIGVYPGTGTGTEVGSFDIAEDVPTLNPANGNYYRAVPAIGIGWDDARIAAEGMSYMGIQGHLATLTDQAENDFVYSLQQFGGGNNVHRHWIGGFQDLNATDYSEPGGGWRWITGEPFVYTNWLPGEPNDTGAFASEDFLELLQNFGASGDVWNDAHPMEHPEGYVVEFSGLGGGSEFCQGDGGNQMGCTNCPCGNNAGLNSPGGCLNSDSRSARLIRSGTPSIAADTLRFELSGAVSQTFGILSSGAARAPSNSANPCFGLDSGIQSVTFDGLRCAVQFIQRHGTRPSDINGDIGVTTNGWGPPNGPTGGLAAMGGFASGQTRHFQVVYRDNPAVGCGTGQNTSQGVTVVFNP